jgi:hypothetical protein
MGVRATAVPGGSIQLRKANHCFSVHSQFHIVDTPELRFDAISLAASNIAGFHRSKDLAMRTRLPDLACTNPRRGDQA